MDATATSPPPAASQPAKTERAFDRTTCAFLLNQSRQLFLVADTVPPAQTNDTSSKLSSLNRPATIFVAAAHVSLQAAQTPLSTDDFRTALAQANHRLEEFNDVIQASRQSNPPTQIDSHLLWGAFGAIMHRLPNSKIICAHLGSCGIARLDETGAILWISDNQIAQTKRINLTFPVGIPLNLNDSASPAHSNSYCNLPHASYATYGLLNGQTQALDYVEYNVIACAPTDTIILFSSNFRPAVQDESASAFRQQLVSGAKEEDVHSLQSNKHDAVLVAVHPLE